MKKTYNSPSTKVLKIAVHQMVAASQLGIGETVTSASGAETRENNAWDIWGEVEDDVEE